MMLIRIITICLLLINISNINAYDIKIRNINKSVESLDQLYISQNTPLELTLSCAYINYCGEKSLWHKISTFEYNDFLDPDAPNITVSDNTREKINNQIIKEEYTCDSVGAVIHTLPKENIYYIRYCWIENDKWVNAGEDIEFSIEDAQKKIKRQLNRLDARRKRVKQIMTLPTDITPFSTYLKNNNQTPADFILSALKKYRLVINGEFHRRKASWDVLTQLIRHPQFPATTGTIFMELPSHRQADMDLFMKSDTLNVEILLDIFRDEQPNGWWDKGEFDFLCTLWEINKNLSSDRKISVRLADFQLPYSSIRTKEELDSLPEINRNTHMTNIIIYYINSSSDIRSSLFLVGCGHVAKSKVAGMYSGGDDFTAGHQLTEKLGENNVFTIFQHNLTGDNIGRYKQPIRAGIFDKAFAENNNIPVGFSLKNSPFGVEPFDGIYEYKFTPEAGTFSDNFDGYIFFGNLSEEPKNDILEDIFSQKFIDEMKRRAHYMNIADRKDFWFGVTADEMTPEIVIKALKE